MRVHCCSMATRALSESEFGGVIVGISDKEVESTTPLEEAGACGGSRKLG